MFRPFLPCGIAYGFAYALPMALPMAFHALFPAEGIPPGCLYCTISARCLSTGFGRISAAFAFFRRRGVPPCRGGLLRRCRRGGRWRRPAGGVLSLSPAYSAFSFCFSPYPPSPRSQSALPRRGRGRLKVYFAGGFAPGTPALNRLRHLQTLPYRHPAKGSLRLGAKTVEMLSFGQCRQPRRGGTGGEELRRLRWSSPPGQG